MRDNLPGVGRTHSEVIPYFRFGHHHGKVTLKDFGQKVVSFTSDSGGVIGFFEFAPGLQV